MINTYNEYIQLEQQTPRIYIFVQKEFSSDQSLSVYFSRL